MKTLTAIYNYFEYYPDAELEFYIAEQLGWRSVEEMRAGMSNFEFMQWCIYYGRIAQRKELEMKELKGIK